MKNRIKQYLLAASMCVGLTACSDFFEPIPGVQFGLDETFASKQRTEEYLNNVYSYVREVTDAIHPNTYGGIFTEASLDGANRWNKTYAEWTNGSFNSASAQASEYFSKYYQAIAKASTFIQNVDKCTEAAASTRGKWKSEARALRAYYYFELLRLYGPIPLIGEDPIPLDTSLLRNCRAPLIPAICSREPERQTWDVWMSPLVWHSRQSCTSIGQVRFSTEIRIRRQSRIKTANNFSLRPKITPNGLRHAMHMNGL